MVPNAIPFPVPDPHYAYVRTRKRSSGLTSVRWHDDETLFAGDFAAKAVYRVRPFSDKPIDASIPTLDGAKAETETDLMDLRGDVVIMSNFYTGEVAFYTANRGALRFERVIRPPRPANPGRTLRSLARFWKKESLRNGRKIHGVRFVPGYDDLLWVSFCDAHEPGIEIVTREGKTIHSIPTAEQAQDTAFVEHGGVTYAVEAARTDHITVDAPNESNMYATLYVYRLPQDLRAAAPELVTQGRFTGHIDAIKEFRNRVYAANQHDDSVDEFTYSPEKNEITLTRRISGFDMPHGLDIRHDGLLAVTNYGEKNDLRFVQL